MSRFCMQTAPAARRPTNTIQATSIPAPPTPTHRAVPAAPKPSILKGTWDESKWGIVVAIVDESLTNTIRYLGSDLAESLPSEFRSEFLSFFQQRLGMEITTGNIADFVEEVAPSILEMMQLGSGDLDLGGTSRSTPASPRTMSRSPS
jgi:hypothetical protein